MFESISFRVQNRTDSDKPPIDIIMSISNNRNIVIK
jgi:hypothetical protein